MFSNLFANACEGGSSAPLIGGVLPAWVKGGTRLVFNGPTGLWDFEKESAKHWYDGLSMLQSFTLSEDKGVVQYNKRFLKSDAYKKATANGKLISTEYGTPGSVDPDKNVVSRVISSIVPGEMTDNCACNIFRLGGLTVAATETSLLRPIDPTSLATSDEVVDLSGVVNVASGRPRTDTDGTLYNLTSTFNSGIKYHFIRVPKSSSADPRELANSVVIHSTIPSRMKTYFSYYHSFAMTEHYLIMVEQPFVANTLKLLASRIQGLSFKDCLEWMPEQKNRFHVVEKDTGRLIKTNYVSREPFFFLNFANAFEEELAVGGRQLVVDLVGYDSPDILDQMYLEKLRSQVGPPPIKHPGRVTRFVIPLAEDPNELKEGTNLIEDHGGVRAEREGRTVWLEGRKSKEEGGCDNPVLNPSCCGIRANFCYVTGWMHTSGAFANSVAKVDLRTGDVASSWRGDSFQHPSEPVFMPSGGSGEDDGLLVAPVTDVRPGEKDFLVFLDARNMTEVARASLDADVPLASHGAVFQP